MEGGRVGGWFSRATADRYGPPLVSTPFPCGRRYTPRGLLDGAGDGLLLCCLDGDIGEVVSTNIIMWFGPSEGRKLWELLYGDDPEKRSHLQLLVEVIKDDIMPFEVVVEQMTRRIYGWEGQTFDFEIRKVDLGLLEPQLLFTVRDVTAELTAHRIARAHEEVQTLVSRVVKDVRGFRAFVVEQKALLGALNDSSLDATQVARILHTLKGNAALFGMLSFAESCHILEDRLAEGGPLEDVTEWADALEVTWRGLIFVVEGFLPEDADEVLLSSREYADFKPPISCFSTGSAAAMRYRTSPAAASAWPT